MKIFPKHLAPILILVLFISCIQKDKTNVIDNNIITDDLGKALRIGNVPQRVITLAPNLTEMLFALGEGDKIIGNTLFCNYPDEAKSIKKIGDMFSVDYEVIVALKPDLIFITVEGNSKDVYEKLINLNQKVFVSNPRNFNGIKKTFRDISDIFEKQELSKQFIAEWDKSFDKFRLKSLKRDPYDTFVIISLNPLMTAGNNTFINEFLKVCNLKNIAADSPINYPIMNREEVLKKNPYFIIVTDENNTKDELINVFPEWKNLDVIKNSRIIEIEADRFFRPGPRFITAVQKLFDKIETYSD